MIIVKIEAAMSKPVLAVDDSTYSDVTDEEELLEREYFRLNDSLGSPNATAIKTNFSRLRRMLKVRSWDFGINRSR